jgi:hypothetical protein
MAIHLINNVLIKSVGKTSRRLQDNDNDDNNYDVDDDDDNDEIK